MNAARIVARKATAYYTRTVTSEQQYHEEGVARYCVQRERSIASYRRSMPLLGMIESASRHYAPRELVQYAPLRSTSLHVG